jgi:nitric oxide dioxygenase
MISATSRPYIDASVPVLREHGLAITTRFYERLFAAHPAMKNMFNMGNQANGAQQQSLASAVFAYAANIGNPGALGPVVERIVQKHAAVGIRAEHYPIVGQNLLAAIADTLGDAATPPLLAAWDEAYTSLARLFIAAEEELYGRTAAAGTLTAMRVLEVETQSADVVSIRMAPVDDSAVPAFKAGQYVSVTVTFANGQRQIRQYSLSDAPDGATLRISVKRESASRGAPAPAQ